MDSWKKCLRSIFRLKNPSVLHNNFLNIFNFVKYLFSIFSFDLKKEIAVLRAPTIIVSLAFLLYIFYSVFNRQIYDFYFEGGNLY